MLGKVVPLLRTSLEASALSFELASCFCVGGCDALVVLLHVLDLDAAMLRGEKQVALDVGVFPQPFAVATLQTEEGIQNRTEVETSTEANFDFCSRA